MPRHFAAVLVDGGLAVEAQISGIRTQETYDIGIRWKFLIVAVFKRCQKAWANTQEIRNNIKIFAPAFACAA